MSVRSVALTYKQKGAKAVERADKGVRTTLNKTAKTARKNQGSVSRWLERSKTSIQMLAAASVGALGAILSAAPTMRAELSASRAAFQLFAQTIIDDVFGASIGLADRLFDLEQSYRGLPDPIRETISSLIFWGAALTGVAAVATTLIKVFAPILTLLPKIGAVTGVAAKAFGIASVAVGGLAAALGVTVGAAAALVAGGAVLLGFLAAYALDIRDTRARTHEFIDSLRDLASRGFRWVVQAGERFIRMLSILGGRVADWGRDVYDSIKDRLVSLRDSAFGWGRDVIDRLVSGLNAGFGRLRRAVSKAKGIITDRLSFDIRANDRMAERWGSDLMEHMSLGVEAGQSQLVQSLQAPIQQPTATGSGTTINGGVTVDVTIESTGSSTTDGRQVGKEASRFIENELGARR